MAAVVKNIFQNLIEILNFSSIFETKRLMSYKPDLFAICGRVSKYCNIWTVERFDLFPYFKEDLFDVFLSHNSDIEKVSRVYSVPIKNIISHIAAH